MSQGDGVSAVLDAKVRARYRVTKASLVWFVAALLLIPYEILCVARGVDGGPLTHVVKWAYGQQGSLRWWLLGWPVSGFIAWTVPHFLFDGLGLRSLILFVGAGLCIGAVGAVVTAT
jgi:hypothetical protein